MATLRKMLVLSLACGVAVHFDLVQAKDYYEVLGVTKDSTDKQIKRAFHKMAAKYHPDKNKEEGAEEKFREVAQAYEVLSDQEKRRQYDQFGESAFNGKRGGDSGFGGSHFNHFNYDDILRHFHFDDSFGHGGGGGHHSSFQFSFGGGPDGDRDGFHNGGGGGGGFWEDDPEDMFGDFGFGNFDSFGSGDSFFGTHFGGGGGGRGDDEGHSHHRSSRHHHESHRQHHQQSSHQHTHVNGHGREHHESRSSSSGGGRTCKTVTQRVGNMVTTYTQCS